MRNDRNALLLSIITLIVPLAILAQGHEMLSWKQLYRSMPAEWYGTEQAIAIADTVLHYQSAYGGWPKNIRYQDMKSHSQDDVAATIEAGPTIDNNATTSEMIYLAKVYTACHIDKYRDAYIRGFDYIVTSQYDNGGWPQFFPPRSPQGVHYSMHITYNDEAIVNVMKILRDIYEGNGITAELNIEARDRERAKTAFDKGIQNILDCQIVKDGKRTVWCAQHDHITLAPAKARAYELPSFSGQESVALIEMLMDLPSPSPQVIEAVTEAVDWLKAHAIEGIEVERFVNADGECDCRVLQKESAPLQWARFYDLETEQPFFCDRDGIKRSSLSEVGIERRGGYGWYTTSPQQVIDRYPIWIANVGK